MFVLTIEKLKWITYLSTILVDRHMEKLNWDGGTDVYINLLNTIQTIKANKIYFMDTFITLSPNHINGTKMT